MKIIYKDEDGGVAIIHPTVEALSIMTIEEIASKDVPTGVAFAIIEDDVIPSDRTFRDAWTIDDAELVGGISND